MSTAVIWLGTILAAAEISINNGLTVPEAGSDIISSTLLLANDPDVVGEILTYTLVTTPTNGSLILNGATTLTPTSQFYQSDIDSNLLAYTHNDSETLDDSFDFTVAASDTITNGTFLITITPIFDQIPTVNDQIFSVDENSPTSTAVGTIITADLDAGDSLTYTIIGGNFGTPFALGSSNGAITVSNSSPLDFETNSNLTFTVQVEDMGMLTDTAVITVNVNDMNEPPTISGGPFVITENAAINTYVGTVITSDVDANDTFTYTITASDPSAAFAIGSSGDITVNNSSLLNFESTPTFTLTVQIEDSGMNTDSADIVVNLSDVNEPPVVNPETFTVNENSPNGTLVGSPVTVTDPEEMDSHTYSIIGGNPNNVFTIGSASGQITVTNSTFLDFEAQGATPHYSLTIQASDGSLTGTAIININVNDINEIPTVNVATFTVEENSPNGTPVGIPVIATDPEGPVTYEIISGNTSSAFAIHPTTGQITVANSIPLNFEVTPTFNLTVRVTDNGMPAPPAQTNTATITINLTNKNEMPTVNDATFFISEDSQNGAVVGTVSAFDPDAGDSLTFSFTGTGTAFAINPSTGQITVNDSTQLNADTMPTYNLTVQVLDEGNLPDTATITINVTALPTTYVFLPLILNNYPPVEPNNNCTQAFKINPNTNYLFTADDTEDWYAITLTSAKNITAILSSFEPAQGQLIMYGGTCTPSGNQLILLGNNGDPSTTKTLNIGTRPAGIYYIRVYSVPITNTSYTLRVNIN